MPSSKERQRVEIPTSVYERLKLMAESEERSVTSLVQDLLRLGLAEYQPGWMPRQFMNRFTDPAKHTLALAKEEAHNLGHNYVGTEHLLLGLLGEAESMGAKVLHQLWIDSDQVRKALLYIMTKSAPQSAVPAPLSTAGGSQTAGAESMATGAAQLPLGESTPHEDLGLTPRARTVMALAVDEAQRLHHDYVGTEHILLALAREGEGLAAGILRTFGALGKVREFTLAEIQRREHPSSEGEPSK